MPIVASKKDVFVSYARKDGRDFARELATDLETTHGLTIWQDVVSMAGGENWWQQIREAIEGVHTMLVILTPAALVSPVVKREWAHARKMGTNIIPVTTDLDFYKNAPAWLSRAHGYNFNSAHPDYAASYAAVIEKLQNPPTPKPQPFMLPPLPEQFATRPREQAEILAQLLDEAQIEPRPGVVTLWGAMGFGKTTLALAVAYEPAVIDAFDGILYAEIGESGANVTGKINEMIKALGGSPAEEGNAPARLRELLERRVCLIVFDDVWDAALIQPYLGIEGCTYLITTREPAIAALATKEPIQIREMTTDDAVRLLENYVPEAKRPKSDGEREPLRDLVVRLGEWALLVVNAGRDIRTEMAQGSSIAAAIQWVSEGLDEAGLGAKSDFTAALDASISASLRRFTVDEHQRLFELSIFRDDVDVPEAVAVKLWSGTQPTLREREARRLVRRFAGQFFLRDAHDDYPVIRFHDALREYLSGKLGDTASKAAHGALLDTYGGGLNSWHTLAQDDSYLRDHLVYHLIGAGREADVHALFANTGWQHVRFEGSGYIYAGYIDDLMQGWKLAQAEAERQINNDIEPTAFAQCVRYALIRTSINSLAANYVPEVVARAVELGVWTVDRAMSVAANVPEPEGKAKLYTLLLATAKLNDRQHKSTQVVALAAVVAIDDENYRGNGLSELAPHLPSELIWQVLAQAEAIEDEQHRSDALSGLAAHLPSNLMEQALTATLAIRDEYCRVSALNELAAYLPPELMEQALTAAEMIKDKQHRSDALSGLAAHLPSHLMGQALTAAATIKDERYRAKALSGLGAYLSAEQRAEVMEQALTAAETIEDEQYRADALSELAAHLPSNLMGQALTAAEAIKGQRYRAKALRELGSHLPPELVGQALTVALEISDKFYRAKALIGLGAYLSSEQLADVMGHGLEAVLANFDRAERADALSELAAHLPTELMGQALTAMLAIRYEYRPPLAFSGLAAHLPLEQRSELMGQALTVALAIEDESNRASALSELAAHLPPELMRQALTAAAAIRDERYRAKVLSKLGAHLPSKLMEQALTATLAIRDEYYRALALSELGAHVSAKQRTDVMGQALTAALAIEDERNRAKALSELGAHLPPELMGQALTAAEAIEDEHYRASALSELGAYLPPELMRQALTAAAAIRDERYRAKVLSELGAYLPPELMGQALTAAEAIRDKYDCALALSGLGAYLSGEQRAVVMGKVQTIIAEYGGVSILSNLRALFPLELKEEAMRAAEAIRGSRDRAKALGAFGARLSPELMREALKDVEAISHGYWRAEALSELGAYLPSDLMESALVIILTIENEYNRASALSGLAAYLPLELMGQALAAALAIGDEDSRVRALSGLAAHLPSELMGQALVAARSISSAYYCAIALTAFLERIPHEAVALIREIRQAIGDYLQMLNARPRQEVLDILADQCLFAPPIFAPETLGMIADHVIDICDWTWE